VQYPLLVQGESGTGKELVVWLAHHRAVGRHGQFVSANCAALPESLIEAELFGARRGAFTGADRDKQGLVSVARGGTLFLDEVQQLSLTAQAKLLRFTESGEYMQLGGTQAQRSDARLVCATNTNLRELVSAGKFRADLYYRLSVLDVHTPALSEAPEDIPLFVRHFAQLIRQRLGAPAVEISRGAMTALREASWPGNVRQLIHELERALLRCSGGELLANHLSIDLRNVAPAARDFLEERERMIERWEAEQLRGGLQRTGGNVSQLSRELGISRRWLITKLQRYALGAVR
jgi:transcriptional regulator with PAS, ATPase and Fis domain